MQGNCCHVILFLNGRSVFRGFLHKCFEPSQKAMSRTNKLDFEYLVLCLLAKKILLLLYILKFYEKRETYNLQSQSFSTC